MVVMRLIENSHNLMSGRAFARAEAVFAAAAHAAAAACAAG